MVARIPSKNDLYHHISAGSTATRTILGGISARTSDRGQNPTHLAAGIAVALATALATPALTCMGDQTTCNATRQKKIAITIKAVANSRESLMRDRGARFKKEKEVIDESYKPELYMRGADKPPPRARKPPFDGDDDTDLNSEYADARIKELEEAITAATKRCSAIQRKIDTTNAANLILRSSARAAGCI